MQTDKESADTLAEQYIKLRTKRAKLKEKFEALDGVLAEKMQGISNDLMALCNELNATSIKTAHGTIVRWVTTRYTTSDWDSLHKVILEYNAPYLLEKRIHNTAMTEFLEQHPEAYPPGMRSDNSYTLTVRKPTTKTV